MLGIYAIAGILFFLALIVLAAYFITRQKSDSEPAAPDQVIHTSGIYSIVRRSPREDLARIRPDEKTLRQYVREQSVDMNGQPLDDADRRRIAALWTSATDRNLAEIENGDYKGCEFYYYDFEGPDSACGQHIEKGHFVTREEIFRFPELVPPFHAGCRCSLHGQYGTEKLRDTTLTGMKPFFHTTDTCPDLPDWKLVQKPE